MAAHALPSEWPEQLLEAYREWLPRARRMPHQALALERGKVIGARPDLDRPFVAIHHPVERHAGLAIPDALQKAVAPGRRAFTSAFP
jgi:hypothetical protein